MTKPILISGAGLASLLLARSLLRSKIPFRLFERDASLSFRGQGYRLRLSNEGLDAVEQVLGPEDFAKFYEICGKTGGSGFKGFDAVTGEVLEEKGQPQAQSTSSNDKDTGLKNEIQDKTAPKANSLSSRDSKIVGIARGEMRRFFFEGLEQYTQFNKKAVDYVETPDGDSVKIVFSDGSESEEGSMIIAGEGIKSKIAQKVSGGKLKHYDTRIRGIHGQAPTSAFKPLGEGVFRFKDPRGLFVITNVRAKDMDDPDMQFGWTMIGQPELIKIPNDDYTIVGKTVSDLAKNLTSGWDEKFRPLFAEMVENEAAFWKVTCSTPSGVPIWDNHPRITVIGDAAHSMTPAGGLGANTALRDSALLGQLLKDAGGYKEGLTEEYEEKMRVYGSEAVAQSYGMASKEFGVEIDEKTSSTV
ncbi:uncharacterized protein I303_102011 [Kwoniella dejecticola CBS 10117]|uniref:FAD-binding domain-containing protein n=1 Tax=Kwoniella dejecticola CBS 10117 TaxID=1296121 RepID=A0A1A6AC77_9TREE|nr:uncharacterized protein I303_01851 [Kwoniella dejecticola CBS 10117]OBR87643.1 hypothetical protein I303_01851 [Kwoniella dejecticola CBS 10117]